MPKPPPPEWIERTERTFIAEYNVPPAARSADGSIDAALVRGEYDGEVRYVDFQIGRLLERLRESGALENTIVVVTSDHGESLGEHDYWFEHGRNAYEASCRVPLIVRMPSQRSSVGRRSGDVSLADLAPTLLELAGLPPLDLSIARGPRGISRASLIRSDDTAHHAVFVEKVDRTEQDRAIQGKGVRIGDLKLIQRSTHLAGRAVLLSEELYDLARDPNETQNLIRSPPDAARLAHLRSELARFTAADASFATLAESLEAQRAKLDPETLRIIESLGY
jgi:arylsulfatase A-like enzyme